MMMIASVSAANEARRSRVPLDAIRFDWGGVLDSIKEACGFSEEKELAGYLGISAVQLSEFRSGRTNLLWLAKLRALDALGFHKTSEVIELLLMEDKKERAARARRKRAKQIADGPDA